MVKVSVIIPTWNRGKLLIRAIKSALSQQGVMLEILVCDDGSTDDSRAQVTGLKDKRTHWISGHHSGLPAVPRNRGIKAATGEWLAFLDSDDYWLPGKLEAQLNLARDLRCRAVCTNAYRILPTVKKQELYLNLDKDKLAFFDLVKNNLVISSSMVIHRSVIDKIGLFSEEENLKALEDYAYWLRVATKTEIAYAKSPYVGYTDNPSDSVRKFGVSNSKQQRLLVYTDLLRWFIWKS